jgi:TonB family protein
MIAVVALIAVLATWVMSTRSPNVDANNAMVNKIVADHLAAAQRAFELGSYVDPPGLSAAHFYDAVLELDPTNERAKQGLNAVADRLIADSKQLIGTGDLLRAQSALDNIRRMQPNHRELAEVTASLLSARETERLTIQAANAVASPAFEPIVVTAQHGVVASQRAAAPVSVGKPSANNERKAASRYQRQEYKLPTEPRAVGGIGTASANNSMSAGPLASAAGSSSPSLNSTSQPRDSQLNLESSDSNPKRVDEGKTLEPAQGEVEARAAAVVASMRETTASDAMASSAGDARQSGSGLRDTATKAGIIKPTLIKYVPPVYPVSGRAEGATGWLDVEFVVTSDGRVINPRIAKGTLGSKFHRAALAAANQWKFSPATDAARPDLPMKLRLEFKLTD